VLLAVSCLFGCLRELSHDNNQPSTINYVMLRQDCFNVTTNIALFKRWVVLWNKNE